MIVEDLRTMSYRDAWTLQEKRHAEVVDGGEERILLVEHPPVITTGRRAGQMKHVLQPASELERAGVELVESDRGGDVTFHGPGQLVAYPIIRLNAHGLSVGGYVHRLEAVVIELLKEFGIEAQKDACAVGVWVPEGAGSAKVCAIGVRIRKGVTMHGLALNVSTDLKQFERIVPCGLSGRAVTSLAKLLGERAPSMAEVKERLAKRLKDAFASNAARDDSAAA